jgi:hypothetical protein
VLAADRREAELSFDRIVSGRVRASAYQWLIAMNAGW